MIRNIKKGQDKYDSEYINQDYKMKVRDTFIRKALLGYVENKGLPVSAKEIHSSGEMGNISTVYRGLEYLEKNGSISSITLSCDCGLVRYYYSCHNSKCFLHCRKCHNFFSVDVLAFSDAEKQIEKKLNFKISERVMYFMGECGKCSK